jgi:SagB-type dehydrogenase family enzyme
MGPSSASPSPVTLPAIGWCLRHALGLSAWKSFRGSRWALRVNPSSGNLHPTEAYVAAGGRVWHYAPDRHALEERCVMAADAPRVPGGDPSTTFLVALTSIHWRESWKYGERAFRYCQHDLGHAIAALRLAAALCGWRLAVLPRWSHAAVAALTGVDRDDDFVEAEREDAACVMLVGAGPLPDPLPAEDGAFLDAVRGGRWSGRANQLSEDHVQWTFIDEVSKATARDTLDDVLSRAAALPHPETRPDRGLDARAVILQRRSALALDASSTLDRPSFQHMLRRVLPAAGPPWDALWWDACVHLAIFVHRVRDVEPGIYLLVRRAASEPRLRSAIAGAFDWEPMPGLPLWRLRTGDYRRIARRVSCDQDIAADGFFSLGMLAEFDTSLRERGASFYRPLFWESGVVGQVLYLEAEAAGARSTGIGCFYDDAVHQLLGIEGHALQSLYHFTVGMPVRDTRLTTEPGYPWEADLAPTGPSPR